MGIDLVKRTTQGKVDYLVGEFAILKVLLETMITRIENLDERLEKIESNQTEQP